MDKPTVKMNRFEMWSLFEKWWWL